MTRREYYNLEFYKMNSTGTSERYVCMPKINSDESEHIGRLLSDLGKREPPYLLSEIENALSNKNYEQYYTLDGSMGNNDVEIIPPNAIIHNEFQISLIELKEILQEWISFINT